MTCSSCCCSGEAIGKSSTVAVCALDELLFGAWSHFAPRGWRKSLRHGWGDILRSSLLISRMESVPRGKRDVSLCAVYVVYGDVFVCRVCMKCVMLALSLPQRDSPGYGHRLQHRGVVVVVAEFQTSCPYSRNESQG
jgi:hypothetical protein